MKHSTQYLYGCDPIAFAYMPYNEALIYKREKAKEVMDEIRSRSNVFNKLSEEYRTLTEHYRHAEKAMLFNQQLIDELKGL